MCSDCIDGESNEQVICEKFAKVFQKNFTNSDDNVHLKDQFFNVCNIMRNVKDNNEVILKLDDIVNAIGKMNLSKSLDVHGLCLEHLKYSHPIVLLSLVTMFNACFKFGYVPEGFSDGLVMPLVKNKMKSRSDISNYRPLTIVCVLSKVFNFCINKFIESYFNSDELQLGFVKEGGTEKAIFIMKTICNYFNERGSEVYVAALDASKAFDKVNHYGLLIKLCNLDIPKPTVNVLVKMICNLSFLVKWKSAVSQKINI